MLTISTFFHPPAAIFLGFVLLNGVAQAGAGGYFQACFVGLAALFGHTAVQAFVSGQAVVAVVVNTIELASAIVLLWGHGGTHVLAMRDRTPEETTTFIFLGISTLFLILTSGAYAWLKTMPDYKAAVDSIVVTRRSSRDYTMDEREELLAAGHGLDIHDKGRIWRVARANLIYEISCIYMSVVTLVSHQHRGLNRTFCIYCVIPSRCFRPSPH
jgi:equilibrative nucleoside transporter 1/2/3